MEDFHLKKACFNASLLSTYDEYGRLCSHIYTQYLPGISQAPLVFLGGLADQFSFHNFFEGNPVLGNVSFVPFFP